MIAPLDHCSLGLASGTSVLAEYRTLGLDLDGSQDPSEAWLDIIQSQA